jgi:repressor LexA
MGYTMKQRDLLEFVSRYQREHGVSPTLEEIGDTLGVTRVTAFQHVRALQRKGAVRQEPRSARSLEILDPAFQPTAGIPILGTIAAGAPIEAVEAPEPFAEDDLFPSRGDHYLLRVRGDSMIEDHIADGDLVLVERRSDARDGDTVVAILEGEGTEEATLKRYYREAGGVRLEPRNRRLAPLRVPRCEIRGIVRGVLRRY